MARGKPSGARAGGAVGRGMADSVASVSRERPDDDVRGTLTGDYVVGQVARSLFQGRRPSGDSAARLASLFSSSEPQLQPVYVPVPRVSHRVPFRRARWIGF